MAQYRQVTPDLNWACPRQYHTQTRQNKNLQHLWLVVIVSQQQFFSLCMIYFLFHALIEAIVVSLVEGPNSDLEALLQPLPIHCAESKREQS